jgi:hypothetical protein
MSYAAERVLLGNLSIYRLGVEAYDQDKLGLGPLMVQNGADGFAGPLPIAVGRPAEASTAIAAVYPWAMQWSNSLTDRKDWIFLADNGTAAATRRLVAFEYDRLTGALTWKGFITITFPTATAHTVRTLRMSYERHTEGAVAVAGAEVTGVGTSWQTDGACVGNRIGFGSTDPAQIATWYEINVINSDGSITLTTDAGTIPAGTPYVIEDLRAIIATTNATTTNGGLFVVKGLRYENFQALGTAIPAATTVDNIRACYWLKSAATITETVAGGLGMQAKTSFQSQMCWLSNGTTTLQLFKFNIRAPLTLTAGADTAAFQLATAVSATLTGTASQANNGRVANLGHGPGAGMDCFYFTTTTRVYRSKALNAITASDATWLSGGDNMTEVPPGGLSTVAASGAMNSLEYIASLDKFLIAVSTATANRDYVTQYRTDGGQFDRQVGGDCRQINQAGADSSITPTLTKSGPNSVWVEGGMGYFCSVGTTASTNILYVVPIGADWEYAALTNNRLILPRINVQAAFRFVQAFAQEDLVVGGDTGKNLGMATEPFKLYYRTAGITDNSGAWTLINDTGSLDGVAGAPYIQFMLEFRTIGFTCVPARILNVGVLYDADDALPPELRWNLGDSNNGDGTLGMTQSSPFTALNTMTITYYRADTDAAVLVQSSDDTANGIWQYHNGSTWVAGLGSNAAGVRRRFVPSAGLPVGVDVYAKVVAA